MTESQAAGLLVKIDLLVFFAQVIASAVCFCLAAQIFRLILQGKNSKSVF